MRRRMLPILLSLALCLSLLPTAALAVDEGVTYIERSWDGSTNTVSSEEKTKPAGEYTVIDDDTTTWNGSWYVVTDNVTISSRVTVTGDVCLILQDGYTLTVNGGINVAEGNSLTIYGQTAGTGELVAQNPDNDNAGIGGNDEGTGGTVTIHGGNVTATGGINGAGIGGGDGRGEPGAPASGGDGGNVTIYGGTVTATGGTGGAGIGGGQQGAGGMITISGGTVTATSNYAAGIGGVGAPPATRAPSPPAPTAMR